MKFAPIVLIPLFTSFMAAAQETGSPAPNEKAAVYSTVELPPLKALLASIAPAAKILEEHKGNATLFTCQWPDVTVRFTIRPQWDGATQRPKMKEWISSFPDNDTSNPAVQSLLRKMDVTTDCIGSVVTPRFDTAGKASSLILAVASKCQGYVFSQKSFYDVSGAKIIGAPNAPGTLKSGATVP